MLIKIKEQLLNKCNYNMLSATKKKNTNGEDGIKIGFTLIAGHQIYGKYKFWQRVR